MGNSTKPPRYGLETSQTAQDFLKHAGVLQKSVVFAWNRISQRMLASRRVGCVSQASAGSGISHTCAAHTRVSGSGRWPGARIRYSCCALVVQRSDTIEEEAYLSKVPHRRCCDRFRVVRLGLSWRVVRGEPVVVVTGLSGLGWKIKYAQASPYNPIVPTLLLTPIDTY